MLRILSIPTVWQIEISFFLLVFFWRLIFGPTANEKSNHFFLKTHLFFLLFMLFLIFFDILPPIEKLHFFSNLLILLIFFDRFTIVHVVEPVSHAKMHLTLGALKVIYISQLCLAPFRLAVCWPSIFHI